jgi:DNA-binding transcriptional ArsR family regulator
MRLNPIKKTILEAMAKESQSQKPKDIAKRTGLNFSSCMMHILGLKKAGYVSSPEKGYYQITNMGREALKPTTSKEIAATLIHPVAPDKAFYFYTGVDQYSGLQATSLCDFCEKIKEVDAKSVEFHLSRKDFEQWFESLGDHELAKRLGMIREKGASEEDLRKMVYEVAKARCDELTTLSKAT